MAHISGNRALPSMGAISLAAMAGACFAAATLSILDAADGWQQVLDTARQMRYRPGPTCPDQWTVVGWGDGAVLIFGGAGIALVAVTFVGSVAGRRWRTWGEVTALLALVPASLLWMESYFVGDSPIGDCDGIGVSGAAGAALTRAGWLLAGGMVLCFLTYAVLRARELEP